MNTTQYQMIEEQYQLTTYHKVPLVISRGEGMNVYDIDGNCYLDLYGGHAVALTGHCHPKVVKAIQQQAETLLFYSNFVYNDTRAKYSQALIEAAPEGITQVFFCNSGSEANETALKIARRFTGKTEIISMKEGFHGRTIGSLSATGIEKYRSQFQPLLDGVHFADFGSVASVEKLISDDTAAVILEPVQSMAGAYVAEDGYYRALRQLCNKYDIVLIFDEVQTGFGRTGAMFAGENWDITPDIITTAKGIASGVSMGATLVSDEIAKTISYGEHGSTFGGSPLACAAAQATLDVIQEETLVANAKAMGAYLKNEIVKLPGVKSVRGMGLLIGIEFNVPAKQIQTALLKEGYIIGGSMEPNVARLLPPLIIQKSHADQFIAALRGVLQLVEINPEA